MIVKIIPVPDFPEYNVIERIEKAKAAGNPLHFVILGRVAKDVAEEIYKRYQNDPSGVVITSRMGSYPDNAPSAELFLNEPKDGEHHFHIPYTPDERRAIVAALDGSRVSIVHAISGENTSSRALALLGLVDFLKKHGASEINAIITSNTLHRNDRPFHDKNGESQYNAVMDALYPQLLKTAGATAACLMDLHSSDNLTNWQESFGESLSVTSVLPSFVDLLQTELMHHFKVASPQELMPHVMVGSPDGMNKPESISVRNAYQFACLLFGMPHNPKLSNDEILALPYIFGVAKSRQSATKSKIFETKFKRCAGKALVMVDDIISSGGTMRDAARQAKAHGANLVFCVAPHLVLPGDAPQKLMADPNIDWIVGSSTVPSAVEKLWGLHTWKFEIVSPAKMIIQAIETTRPVTPAQTPARRAGFRKDL